MDERTPEEELRMIVQRALQNGPFSMRQLAEDAGLSYQTLRAWASDLRTPQDEYLSKLAAGFRARADKLHLIAEELDRAASKGG
jgi:transcriptional regulator with XRE-family HTH domain